MEEQIALQGVYQRQYRALRRRLCRQAGPSEERDRALETVRAMLVQAQQEGLPPETVYGGEFEDFYAALLAQLPCRLTPQQQAMALMRRCLLGAALLGAALALCVGLYLARVGGLAIWREGFVALDQLRQSETRPAEGEFSLTLDLARPQENQGQPLYRQDGCSITVAGVYRQPDGNVCVTLRCQGEYDLKGGRLVALSGFADGEALQPELRFQVELNGQTFSGGYALPGAGLEKGGCQCALLLFPPDQLPQQDWRQQENQIAHIQLGGLAETIWR